MPGTARFVPVGPDRSRISLYSVPAEHEHARVRHDRSRRKRTDTARSAVKLARLNEYRTLSPGAIFQVEMLRRGWPDSAIGPSPPRSTLPGLNGDLQR